MEKEKSLLEQHYGLIAFCGMCLLSPLGALMLYKMYRGLRRIGLFTFNLLQQIVQIIFDKLKR